MKKIDTLKRKNGAKTLLALIFLFPYLFLFSSTATATARDPGETSILPAGEVVEGDYFAWGDVVEILGTVHGDVYAAGGEVRVSGEIDGDLLAAGGKITLSGRVSQNARIAGGKIIADGVIGRNLTVAGSEVDLNPSASIQGDVTAAAGELTVSSRIGGDLTTMTGKMRITPAAEVAGNVSYRSRRPAAIDPEAKIAGKVTAARLHGMFNLSPGQVVGALAALFFFFKAINFISTLIVGLLIVFLFPGFSREVVSTLQTKPIASLGWGLAWLIVTPVVLIFLLTTVIGIPLALILFPLYLTGLYLARLVIILWAGTTILERMGKSGHEGWGLLIGLLIYTVATLIPGPGGVVSLLVILFGAGAALLTAKGHYRPA
ncbi:MAG: hypothetical protein WAO55_15355 [Candidatus Manganitrophaceae bacterium]